MAYLWNNFAKRFGREVCHHPIQAYSMIIAEKSYYKLKQTKNVGVGGRHFLLNLMTTYNFASETGDDILHHLRHRNKLNGVGSKQKENNF